MISMLSLLISTPKIGIKLSFVSNSNHASFTFRTVCHAKHPICLPSSDVNTLTLMLIHSAVILLAVILHLIKNVFIAKGKIKNSVLFLLYGIPSLRCSVDWKTQSTRIGVSTSSVWPFVMKYLSPKQKKTFSRLYNIHYDYLQQVQVIYRK